MAEAELVYKDDHVSHSVYVTFDIDEKASIKNATLRELVSSIGPVQLLVWTTTPWTLTANMVSLFEGFLSLHLTISKGIAVHRDLTYCVLRPTAEGGKSIIVAKDRMDALADLLGPSDILAEIKGYFAHNRVLSLSLTQSYCRI